VQRGARLVRHRDGPLSLATRSEPRTGPRIQVLGPVAAELDGRLLLLGGPKQRAVLAALALQAGRAVSVDALLAAVWGEEAPGAATKTLQVYVANLRRALEPDRAPGSPPGVLLTQDPGYLLDLPVEEVDAVRFERTVARARDLATEGRLDAVSHTLREALAAWRGAPLAGLEALPIHDRGASRLVELRLDALELCCAAELELGLQSALVPELRSLVDEAPYRERLRALLVRALYASGRQRDALAAYQDARQTLIDDLGIEPGPELRDLEHRVLEQDGSLDIAPKSPTARPPHDEEDVVRKQVSIVAVVTGGQLDGRALRTTVDEHAGTVLELSHDRLVAAFGVPRLAADDVDRAARLALTLARRHLSVGVATGTAATAGEAVSGAPLSRALELATGSAPGTTAIDPATRERLGGRATVTPSADGSIRLTDLAVSPADTVPAGPFMERDHELELLITTWRAAVTGRPGLVTLIGDPGIGTTRLATELALRVGAPTIHVAVDPTIGADVVVDALRRAPDGSVVVLEHVHRAARAASSGLAQWVQGSRTAPVLCIATATPELRAVAPAWPGPLPLAVALDVHPLSEEGSRRLASHLLADDVTGERATNLARASGGNPLLATLLAQHRPEDDAGIHRLATLFGMRIEALAPTARRLLEAIGVLDSPATPGEVSDVAGSDELASDVDELISAGLVALVGDERIAVTNPLVADIVLASTADDRASQLHERAAATSIRPSKRAAHLKRALDHAAADAAAAKRIAPAALDATGDLAWRMWERGDAETAVDAAHRAIAIAASADLDLTASLRSTRRGLAAAMVSGQLGTSPMATSHRSSLGAWDAARPVELDLAEAARSLAAHATDPGLRRVCEEVAAALSGGSGHGSSPSSSA
jgi:DNA-binding SARP family transcriptional activator